jgi:hypothetical protein
MAGDVLTVRNPYHQGEIGEVQLSRWGRAMPG